MQVKNKYFYVLCVLAFSLVLFTGCGFSREVLLEDSGHELEVVTGKDPVKEDAPAEDALVITGQITESGNTTEADTDTIYVYICGQVQHPGVYQVPSDARVFSVIQLAGGLTEDADETGVNQAQNLIDGQMIYIPAVGEVISSDVAAVSQGTYGLSADSSKVNINTADLEALMSLPGIGEGKAQSILAYRQEHGSFQSIEEIMNVDGIKEGTYSKFKDKITI